MTHTYKPWALALIVALFALGGASRLNGDEKKSDEKKAEPITVPFEMLKTGHMAVMIKVNDKGPYRVIFDTGAPICLLSTKVSKDAGVATEAPKGLAGLLGVGGQAKVKTLNVGDAKLENASFIVMDHPTIKALAEEVGALEGIIGFPVFARFKTTLNYRDKTLTFVPNGFEPPDVMESMMSAMTGLLTSDKTAPKQILSPSAQWGMIVAKKEGDDDPGVNIKEVFPGGAAEAAGLKPGDRTLTLDARWTDSVADTFLAAGFVKPGEAVKVVIKRDGKEKELTVKPKSGL